MFFFTLLHKPLSVGEHFLLRGRSSAPTAAHHAAAGDMIFVPQFQQLTSLAATFKAILHGFLQMNVFQ